MTEETSTDGLSLDERVDLICRGLQEVIGGVDAKKELMKKIMAKRPLRIYWGTAPTGAPHIGYFVPMLKIADFLQAGAEVVVLLADLHASLDALKSTFDLVESRTNYYEAVLRAMLEAVGVSTELLTFVRGSDFQLRADYTLDLYKLMAITSFRHAARAGAEVVKQAVASGNEESNEGSALMSGLAYPLLQALDEVYLDVDVQFGGIDQRKIFIYAEEFLAKLDPAKKNKKKKSADTPVNTKKYFKRIHLCNPMVPSMGGGKMSSSGKDKISILAEPGQVEKLVRKAFCQDCVIEENGLLAFCEYVLFPWRQHMSKGDEKAALFEVTKDDDTVLSFSTYKELETGFAEGKVTPQLLKQGVTKNLNQLLSPIQNDKDRLEHLLLLHDTAYPEDMIVKKRPKGSTPPAPSRLEKIAAATPASITEEK